MGTATEMIGNVDVIPPFPVRRFTVDEYHLMIRTGVFGEDEGFELLEGWIVPKMMRNPPHDVAIVLTNAAIVGALPAGWHIRQQSATTTAESEPEPDLAVVRGRARDYLGRHPGPADTALVVEVADSSPDRDRGIKARLYARAGYPAYWLLNLVDRRLEVRTDASGPAAEPSYRRVEALGPGDAAPLVLDGREVGRIAVGDLLP